MFTIHWTKKCGTKELVSDNCSPVVQSPKSSVTGRRPPKYYLFYSPVNEYESTWFEGAFQWECISIQCTCVVMYLLDSRYENFTVSNQGWVTFFLWRAIWVFVTSLAGHSEWSFCDRSIEFISFLQLPLQARTKWFHRLLMPVGWAFSSLALYLKKKAKSKQTNKKKTTTS